jgi:DNA repair protein RadC
VKQLKTVSMASEAVTGVYRGQWQPESLTSSQLLEMVLGVDPDEIALLCNRIPGEVLPYLRGLQPDQMASALKLPIETVIKLRAALELGKRTYMAKPLQAVRVDNPAELYGLFAQSIAWEPVECFAVASLNVKHQVLGVDVISRGTKTETLAHPAEIFGAAIRRGAARIAIAHNHPSGSVEPSPEDIALTKQIIQAAKVMGIPVLDHLIIAGNDFTSLRETHYFEWEC